MPAKGRQNALDVRGRGSRSKVLADDCEGPGDTADGDALGADVDLLLDVDVDVHAVKGGGATCGSLLGHRRGGSLRPGFRYAGAEGCGLLRGIHGAVEVMRPFAVDIALGPGGCVLATERCALTQKGDCE